VRRPVIRLSTKPHGNRGSLRFWVCRSSNCAGLLDGWKEKAALSRRHRPIRSGLASAPSPAMPTSRSRWAGYYGSGPAFHTHLAKHVRAALRSGGCKARAPGRRADDRTPPAHGRAAESANRPRPSRGRFLLMMEAAGLAPASAKLIRCRQRAFPSESDLGVQFGRSAGHVPGATPSCDCPPRVEGPTFGVSPLSEAATRTAGASGATPSTGF
jgi:hypothetical protein